jgi:hypothetical protein
MIIILNIKLKGIMVSRSNMDYIQWANGVEYLETWLSLKKNNYAYVSNRIK